MDDLELTKLVAEAMGLTLLRAYPRGDLRYSGDGWNGLMYSAKPHPCLFINSGAYDPLHDDAQAMALVKKLKPANLSYNIFAGKWSIHTLKDNEDGHFSEAFDADLNRAICECTAKMQAARKAKGGR